jgi:hypothetical protein
MANVLPIYIAFGFLAVATSLLSFKVYRLEQSHKEMGKFLHFFSEAVAHNMLHINKVMDMDKEDVNA